MLWKYASWMSKASWSAASSLTNQRNWKSCLRFDAAHAMNPVHATKTKITTAFTAFGRSAGM